VSSGPSFAASETLRRGRRLERFLTLLERATLTLERPLQRLVRGTTIQPPLSHRPHRRLSVAPGGRHRRLPDDVFSVRLRGFLRSGRPQGNAIMQARLERRRPPRASPALENAAVTTAWLAPGSLARSLERLVHAGHGSDASRFPASAYDFRGTRANWRRLLPLGGVLAAAMAGAIFLSHVPFQPYPEHKARAEIFVRHRIGAPLEHPTATATASSGPPLVAPEAGDRLRISGRPDAARLSRAARPDRDRGFGGLPPDFEMSPDPYIIVVYVISQSG